MQQIDRKIIKKRTKRLAELFQSYTPYDHQLGKEQTILITEVAHDGRHYVGHNKFYEQVLVPMKDGWMGKNLKVKIYETGKHFLRGDPLGEEAVAPTSYKPQPVGSVASRWVQHDPHKGDGDNDELSPTNDDHSCACEQPPGGGCCSTTDKTVTDDEGGSCGETGKATTSQNKVTSNKNEEIVAVSFLSKNRVFFLVLLLALSISVLNKLIGFS